MTLLAFAAERRAAAAPGGHHDRSLSTACQPAHSSKPAAHCTLCNNQ